MCSHTCCRPATTAPQQGKSDFLVFNEFGGDFVARRGAADFEVELLRDAVNPALVTFIAQRPFGQTPQPEESD